MFLEGSVSQGLGRLRASGPLWKGPSEGRQEDHWESEILKNKSRAAAPSPGELGQIRQGLVWTAALGGPCWKLSVVL